VLGYGRTLAENLHLKAEAYYQSIFDAPVERTPSYYSVLTEGADFAPTDRGNLVNAGTGRNYGPGADAGKVLLAQLLLPGDGLAV
jgi:hypothetical protein